MVGYTSLRDTPLMYQENLLISHFNIRNFKICFPIEIMNHVVLL